MIKKILILITLTLILTSCLELNVHYVINPDYSGKVNTEYIMPVNPFGMGNALNDPEGKANKELYKMFDEYPGVKVWSNISFDFVNDSNDLVISATGYFDDFNTLNKKGMLPYELKKENGNTLFTFSTFLDSVQNIESQTELKSLKELGLSEKQLKDSIRILKRNAKKGIGMFAMIMSNIEFKTTYEFAGKISSDNGNKIGNGSQFDVGIDGLKFQNFMMEELDNDEYYENIIRGATPFDVDEDPSENDGMKKLILEFLSGEKEDISKVQVEFEKPIFDYKKELKQAKKEWEEWQKSNKRVEENKDMKKS